MNEPSHTRQQPLGPSTLLTIVIPALNEEQSIASVCRLCLEQAPGIRKATGHELELIVVDDGSADRTAEVAGSIDGVEILSLERNRGYGAALMRGFRQARGELIGFLDADGTCDPKHFVPMVRAVENGASVALGNRLGPDSHMPAVRRLGNRFFAWLIRLLSGARIADAASGMRVLRKDSLELLAPLPDGLQFTPAMSCRAALDPRLSLVEVPISYAERQGESKLGVVRDGLRFLKAILEIAVTYRPLLLFGAFGCLLLLIAVLYAIDPVWTFLQRGELPEDRVYRVLTIVVLAASGLGSIYVGALAEKIQELINPRRPNSTIRRFVRSVLFAHPFLLATICLLVAVLANASALYQYLTEGAIRTHWARTAFGAVLGLAAVQLVTFGLLNHVVGLLAQRVGREPDPGGDE
ncbi:MAG: glycosyltransferase family 2 protein [Planctomycetota bacterium]